MFLLYCVMYCWYCNLWCIILKFIQEFFEYIEKERSKDFEILARKYRAVGPLLTKMEGLVAHTNTGRSAKFCQYYAHWEQKIYGSLTKVGLIQIVLERYLKIH